MSRNFTVLSKVLPGALHPETEVPAAAAVPPDGHRPEGPRPDGPEGEFAAVIRLLFAAPAAVAIVGSRDSEDAAYRTARGLAEELATSGNRVVLVPVKNLLRMNPINVPDPADYVAGSMPRLWLWPAPVRQKIEFFRSPEAPREPGLAGNWLDALRRNFDAVVLDCPGPDAVPGVTEIAAMADAAVLAVEAGRTSAEQLRHNQQALQLRGARVVGCILIS